MQEEKDSFENRRLSTQAALDAQKTAEERNQLGQFATPTVLARDVVRYGLNLLSEGPIRFIDPAIGTGSFYSALLSVVGERRVESARGFEIDCHYGQPATELWKQEKLLIKISDFTRESPPVSESEKATLFICNPPYVRHHHIDGSEKNRLQSAVRHLTHTKLSGLAGLYCYFMLLADAWLAQDAVAGWLIPSEFMDVNYGRQIKHYLLHEVTLLHIHRFDPSDVQFDDALVSSAVVWFKKKKPVSEDVVRFTYGGTLQSPHLEKEIPSKDLKVEDKWTRYPRHDPPKLHGGYKLGDFFSVKRGLATGDNNFFILSEGRAESLELPSQFLRPILPSARYIKSDEITADKDGIPLLEKRLFLLDCSLPEEEIQKDFPRLWDYLKTGLENVSPRYLCQSRRRWYMQENRPPAPIICTYIGRGDHDRKPFRFLLNSSKATATNVFLMLYPQPVIARLLEADPSMLRELWRALNSFSAEELLGNGRVYGGGMYKLEPRELANVPADSLAEIVGLGRKIEFKQIELLELV